MFLPKPTVRYTVIFHYITHSSNIGWISCKKSPYNATIILHAWENIYMPCIARQCYVVVNIWLHKVHHSYGYKVHATFHLCIPENNMCMRQQLVLNHRIVLSNPTKTTLRNWCICFYYYRFNYAIMHFCNRLDARWSHRVWHVWYLGFFILREKKRRAQSTNILHLDYCHVEIDK